MKKLLIMLSSICVLAITLTVFAVSATAANGPTVEEGDIIEAQSYVDAFHGAEGEDEKLAAAKDLVKYMYVHPVSIYTSKIILDKIYGDGDAKYAEFEGDLNKVMAYGAVSVLKTYDEKKPIYECRSVVNWASMFMEYDIADLLVDDVTSADFFADGAATVAEGEGEGAVPDGGENNESVVPQTVGMLYAEKSADVEKRMADALQALSNEAFSEYESSQIRFQPDFSMPTLSIVANVGNTTFHGIVYKNGYRRDDYLPVRNYVFSGLEFSATSNGAGTYDKLEPGQYVIFDDGVEDYYVSVAGSNNTFEKREGYVKRNYIYDISLGDYIKVEDGEGLYDLIEDKGYGQLLVPDPYYVIDMTGKRVSSGVPYGYWNAGGSGNVVIQFDLTYTADNGYAGFAIYYKDPDGVQNAIEPVQLNNGKLRITHAHTDANDNSYAKNREFDVIVPGKWTNVCMVVGETSIDIYFDYVFIGTVQLTVNNSSTVGVRAMVHGSNDLGYAVDNVVLYDGTLPRNLDMFSNMTDYEKFIYFGDYISGDGSATARMYAYNQMKASVSKYFVPDAEYVGDHIDENGNLEGGLLTSADDKALERAVKQFYSFDLDAIVEEYKAEKLEEYKSLVETFKGKERLYSTIPERTSAKDAIDAFYARCCDTFGNPIYIDVDSEAFQAAEETKIYYEQLLANDIESNTFVEAMNLYNIFKV